MTIQDFITRAVKDIRAATDRSDRWPLPQVEFDLAINGDGEVASPDAPGLSRVKFIFFLPEPSRTTA